MKRLDNPVRHYAWGSTDTIPNLIGVPSNGQPYAELWLGANERASSLQVDGVDRVSLTEVVEAAPAETLGPSWEASRRLPFLAKVLAVREPLSLQVHPPAAATARGFAAEEAAGLDRDDPRRNFPDDVVKAEMVLALSPFVALCGFAAVTETIGWLEELALPPLKPTVEALDRHGASALAGETERLLTTEAGVEAVTLLSARPTGSEESGFRERARVAASLAERHPGDPAVAVALLLRPVLLATGGVMAVRPGQLHTYLSGTAFETQANSDNVLRAGLTEKHVDAPAVLDALDGLGDETAALTDRRVGAERVLAPPTRRFALAVIRVAEGAELPVVPGPQIFCCINGAFELTDATGTMGLQRGRAAFAAAEHPHVRVTGRGMLLRVTTGRAEERT